MFRRVFGNISTHISNEPLSDNHMEVGFANYNVPVIHLVVMNYIKFSFQCVLELVHLKFPFLYEANTKLAVGL